MGEPQTTRSHLRDELVSIYRSRWWTIASIVVSLLVAAAYNRLSRPVYIAESVLALERRGRFPGIPAAFEGKTLEAAISEQTRTLRSPALAEAVVEGQNERLTNELSQGPIFNGISGIREGLERLIGRKTGKSDSRSELVRSFLSRLDISQSNPASWIVVRFSSYDPAAGALAANALIARYADQLRRNNDAALSAERSGFENVVGSQKEQVGGAMGALNSETKGANPTAERALIQRQVASLQDQYADVTSRIVTMAAEIATRQKSENGGPASNVDSPRSQALQTRLDSIRADLAAKQENLGDKHPEVAALLSQARALESSLKSESAAELERLEATYALLTRQRDSLSAAINRAMSEGATRAIETLDAAVLMRQADASERTLSELIDRSQRGSELVLVDARTVQKAEAPDVPAYPERVSNYGRALIVGFVFGVLLIRFREAMNETIRTVDELKRLDSGLSLLGTVPLDLKVRDGGLSTLFETSTPVAEAYRVVRANLPKDFRALAVTSAGPGDGKSTTAAALALLLGQGSDKVLLIDGDMRRPTLNRVLGVESRVGLAEALGGANPDDCMVRTSGIDFMPAGHLESNAAAALGDQAFGALVRAARARYRYVVIDTPPALALADASSIGREVDGMILVVGSGQTPRGALLATAEQLARQGVVVLGLVLNRLNLRDRADYYGGYYRSYARYYSTAASPGRGPRWWPWRGQPAARSVAAADNEPRDRA
jgi:succinoglycan biosynthesis transport protein ExoP